MVRQAERGVILIHVMVLITLLAWLASMFLSAVLSRQINAKQTMKSSDIRMAMSAASARITSCLAGVPGTTPSFPTTPNCSTSMAAAGLLIHMQACLGGSSATKFIVGEPPNNRPVVYAMCGTPIAPPCRFRVHVCEPGDVCAPPVCP